jgi:hypothetical protein
MSQMITDEVNKGAEIDGREIDFAFDLNELEIFENDEDSFFDKHLELSLYNESSAYGYRNK